MGSGAWKYRDLIGYTSVGRLVRSPCTVQLSSGNYAALFANDWRFLMSALPSEAGH